MKKKTEKEFKSYPDRTITLSDEVWKALKAAKLAHGKNWNKFIKSLIESYEDKN